MNGVCEGPYEDLAGLYAEQTHVTHPFHPLNPPPLRSRGELHDHFTAPPPDSRTLNRKPVDITIHETADPEVIVAEFAYRGQVDETGEAFTVPCIFVMRIRDGLIVESRRPVPVPVAAFQGKRGSWRSTTCAFPENAARRAFTRTTTDINFPFPLSASEVIE